MVLVLTFIASLGYWLVEQEYTWLDAIYMTVLCLSTVGLDEVGDLSRNGRIWTIIVICIGLITLAGVISMLGGIVVEGRLRKLFGRRQLERKIAALTGHVVVCGYGRMGSEVADELAMAGRKVVVIDVSEDRIAAADAAGLLHIRGDAQEEQLLQTAGVDRAHVLVASLPDDADNLFVTLSARQANPRIRIVARAEQEASQRKLIKAGANSVVCPQTICARRMAGLILRPAVIELTDMARQGLNLEVNQLQVTEGSDLANKTLAELELPRKLGAHVVAVRRADGQAMYHPGPSTKFATGDTLIFIGETGSSDAIQLLQGDASA